MTYLRSFMDSLYSRSIHSERGMPLFILDNFRSAFNVSLALLLLTFAGYCAVIHSYFLSDDFNLIGRISREGYFAAWGEDTVGFLRPVTTITFLTDYRIWGFNPTGYHLTNIILHAAAGILVLLVARRLFDDWGLQNGDLTSIFVAGLFIVLPSHTESVSWISGRTDLIATVFSLASVLAYMTVLRRRSFKLSTLTVMLFIVALLAKESAIIVPVVWLILYSCDRSLRARGGGNSRFALLTLICSIPVLAGYLFLRKAVLGYFIGGPGTNQHLALLNTRSIGNLLRYSARVMMPPFLRSSGDLVPSIIVLCLTAILGFLAVRILIVILRGRIPKRQIGLCLMLAACFLVCLLPVLTLKVSLFDTRSERFLYMPSVFSCILAGAVITLLFRKTRRIVVISTIILALEFIALQRVNSNWVAAGVMSERISAQVLRYDPDSTVILNIPDNLCGAYVFRNGLTEATSTFQGIETAGSYRIACTHSILTGDDSIYVIGYSDCVVLILPGELEFCMIDSLGQRAKLMGDTLIIEVQDTSNLVLFNQGSMWPLVSREH